MRHLAFFLFAATSALPAFAAAQPHAPRLVVRDDGGDVSGFPAVSADGATIAHLVPFETTSEAELIAVDFIRVSDGAIVDRWLVLERNDDGARLPPPGDGRGDTPWRRARKLTLQLRASGYRALRVVGDEQGGFSRAGPLHGEGLRIAQRRASVTIRAEHGRRVRWRGTMPTMTAFCGMSDERPRSVPATLQNAWVDPSSNVALLEVGHVYASCMCPSDLLYVPVTLAP